MQAQNNLLVLMLHPSQLLCLEREPVATSSGFRRLFEQFRLDNINRIFRSEALRVPNSTPAAAAPAPSQANESSADTSSLINYYAEIGVRDLCHLLMILIV